LKRILLPLTLLFLLSLPVGVLAASGSRLGTAPKEQLGVLDAKAAIALDAGSGEVLYEYHPDELLAPASTIKIMTAVLIQEAADAGDLSLTDTVTVTEEMIADTPEDASRMSTPLTAGEQLTVEDLLYAHLLSSDCMASSVLACVHSGSEEAFCLRMEERARELGCGDSTFVNASGYPDEQMLTSARSLSLMAMEFLKHEKLAFMASQVSYTIPATNLNPERTLTNSNLLLHQTLTDSDGQEMDNPWYSPAATGLKTGTSTPSGFCLVSTFEANGRRLLLVLLGGEARELEDGSLELPQYSETIRVADLLFTLLGKQAAITEDLQIRLQAVAAQADSRTQQTALGEIRNSELQALAAQAAALSQDSGQRIPIAGAALAVLLLLSIPAAIIRRVRH